MYISIESTVTLILKNLMLVGILKLTAMDLRKLWLPKLCNRTKALDLPETDFMKQ